MKSKDNIHRFLASLKEQDASFEWKEEAIAAEYRTNEGGGTSLILSILSILGGILATLAFLGFVFMTGLYESVAGQIMLGIALIVFGIWLSRQYGRVFLDTLSVTGFISGLILLAIGLGSYHLDLNSSFISMIAIVVSLIAIGLAQTRVLTFICVLIINGCILQLILSNSVYGILDIFTAGMAVLVTLAYLNEAKIIAAGPLPATLYSPVSIGLVLSFVSCFAFFGMQRYTGIGLLNGWIPSIVNIAVILYVVYRLLYTLELTKFRYAILVVTALVLLPVVLAPAITGSLLVLLLGFYVNHKTTFVLGILSFIYFVIQYYYDLELTLLVKSIVMFGSGILFLLLYFFTSKKLAADEKI